MRLYLIDGPLEKFDNSLYDSKYGDALLFCKDSRMGESMNIMVDRLRVDSTRLLEGHLRERARKNK